MNNLQRIDKMTQLLTTALNPSFLEIIDDSHKHVGHAGAQSGMGHFSVIIGSSKLEGLPPVRAHQLIYEALGELMTTDIHALSISVIDDQ